MLIELLQESLKIYNLPATILLGMIIVYWIVALIGVIDLDIDLDLDSDAEAVGSGNGGFLSRFVKISGFTEAPLIFILSVFALFFWATSVLANRYFNPENTLGFAIILSIPVLLISSIITRLLITPLQPLVRYVKAAEPTAKIIGEEGTVKSVTLDRDFGRIEIKFDGKPLLLNAVLSEGATDQISKGAKVLVVAKLEGESDTYIVRAMDS